MNALAALPVLQTERMILAAPAAGDSAPIMDFLQSERARFYGGPMDRGDAWRKVAAYAGQWLLRGYGMFAMRLKASGETVGMAGPVHPETFPEPEMSWLLTAARHEGQGLVTEAARAVLDHLFARHGWASLPSYIDPENTASRAVAERLGATPDPATPAPAPLAGCDTFRHFAPGSAR